MLEWSRTTQRSFQGREVLRSKDEERDSKNEENIRVVEGQEKRGEGEVRGMSVRKKLVVGRAEKNWRKLGALAGGVRT